MPFLQVAEKTDLARIITKAKVFKLVTDKNACVGCVYEKGGQNFQEFGPVILASGGAQDLNESHASQVASGINLHSATHAAGGFGADFTQNSLLAKYRPDLLHLPTTNGEHCTGDGIKMGEARPSIPPCSRCTLSCRQSPAALESPFLSGDRREDHRPGVGAGPPHRPREAGRRRCQDQVPRRRGHAYVVLTPPKHRLHIPLISQPTL